MSSKRLTFELNSLRKSMPREISSIVLVNEDIKIWNVTVEGPEDSPYEGGKFIINLDFTDYPFKSPRISFKTKIFHPSVSD